MTEALRDSTESMPDIVALGLQDADIDIAQDVLQDYRVHALGRIALLREMLKEMKPKAVLSEIWLRDGHCLEVKELLSEHSPHTPMVVVVSSLEGDAGTLDFGSNHFLVLQRPLRRTELASAIHEAEHAYALRSRLAELEGAAESLKRESEEATRLKSEFLSLISHELRTPLTEVIGYSELLAGGGSTGSQVTEFARNIVRSANQLKGLIDDLVTLSKAEAGVLPLELATFPVDQILEGKVGEMVREARDHGLTVQVIVAERVGLINADRGKLSKVLQNLLSNAVKFSPPGGTVVIEVSDAGPAVLFSVTDAGKGISAEKLRSLFLAFRQEDSSDRREFGGLGIGLSIVKRFVELHGGSVRVASRPDRGTAFSFVIPRRPAKPGTPAR